ncbi:hypothetical protein BH18GEM1_BH18GEM1_10350 [soil metagenome]
MFAVLTRILNEDDLLRPGMNADVEVVIGTGEGVLALPNGAVKTVDEARQLATALGIEIPGGGAEERGVRDPGGLRAGGGAPRGLQAMPPGAGRIGGGSTARADPGLPKPAFVFRRGPQEALRLEPV